MDTTRSQWWQAACVRLLLPTLTSFPEPPSAMIIRMFSGQAELLKGHLSANMRAQKESAQRIANATNGGAFADALTGQADIEKEMANLADVQLQTDASARLLGKFYQRMRTAIRDKV